ncbi:Uncharacterized protein family UPF0497 [Macleaya cordata]|uniref:CASP-like protein n=1 Tax=Macleaya cordata TaxID=56857 RepID=A0A200QX47_MACCD|nr:Uncharacterized protein family UPF0497 [Macleaya cordata]
MASTGDTEMVKESEFKTETESQTPAVTASRIVYLTLSLWLRKLLFWTTLVAAIVLLTGKQKENIYWPPANAVVPRSAKYSHYPAFKYLLAALWIVFGHSLLSSINSLLCAALGNLFLYCLILGDSLMLVIMASATGTAGGVAYIGLEGNSHDGWLKMCNVYDKFCRHIAASLALSLLACVILVALILISAFSIRR